MPGARKPTITLQLLYKQRHLMLMSFPFVLIIVLFRYVPLWGWIMAFQDYKLGVPFRQQKWAGLEHFARLFEDPQFYLVMRNTLGMSVLDLVFGFTLPIVFALLLNEIRHTGFKRAIQTISYLPHFVSWVIVASLFSRMLSVDGIANEILLRLRLIDKPVLFLAKENWFWGIVTAASVWKELGWNSIIFLAAIAGIDPNLYEAAVVDGAGRFRQMWSITLPGIRSTVMVILVMSIGWLISIGFERQFLMGNSIVRDYARVLDLYILEYGISMMRFAYGTAIGIFKTVVSVILLVLANRLSRWLDPESMVW